MLYYLFDFLEQNYSFPGSGLFQYISFRSLMALIFSLSGTLVFGNSIIKYLKNKHIGEQIRLLDLAGEETKKNTPTMGGVMIIFFTIIPVILFNKLNNIYVLLLILTLICIGSVGFIDDYIKTFYKNKKGISPFLKIFVQSFVGIVVGITLYFFANIQIKNPDHKGTFITQNQTLKTTIPFFKNNEFDYGDILGYFSDKAKAYSWIIFIPVVIFVIVAVSNGSNLTDGIDGLVSSVSVVVLVILGLLAWISGNIVATDYLNILYIPQVGEILVFVAAFTGALIGFLWFNSYPAQIFMGDTGSLSIGAIIAVLAFVIRKEFLLPLLCGIFLLENLSVMLQVGYFKYTKQKYGVGKRIFLMTPIHHHFQKKGLHESKIVTRFIIVSIIMAALTLLTLKLQ